MTKNMKRIHRVVVKRMSDSDPDTSWLGEYSDTATSEFSIDRTHSLDCPSQEYNGAGECSENDCNGDRESWREYRYFNPSFNYVDKSGHALPENTPEEVKKYVRQDYERMEGLNRGLWCFLGVGAEARVQLTQGGPFQDISSGGLWGIESDSGDYFKEVEEEQLAELRDQLHALGFSQRAISAAFKHVEHREE